MSTEVVTDLERSTGVQHPLVLLQSAIDRGLDPDKLGKLMDLSERWEKNRAAAEFGAALSRFQSECPTVFKSRTATIPGKFEFNFASFDDVMRAAKPALERCGLAISFTSEVADIGIKIMCRVRCGSHFEDHTLTLPIPAGVVTDTQRYGMALSYAKRYCMCAALNIVVTDEDNDAATLCEFILPGDVEDLNSLIQEVGADYKRFLEWLQIESLDKMPRKDLQKALIFLRAKKTYKDKKNGAAK